MTPTLTAVTGVGGFDWMPLIIVALTVLAIAGLIVWHKRNPKQQAETLTAAHVALGNATSAAHDLMREIVAKMGTSSAPAVAELLLPTVVVGKINTPGTFTIEVTGDPAKDLPAINAQYFGS